MGRINNGDWVNQHRKSQGEFLKTQDFEVQLLSKKLSNGNNIQGNNRLNTDDLPNIPAILDYEPNLSRQNIIEPIDGGKAHTPTAQAFLTALTALSAISPNITVSSKKAISTDNQNSLSSTVKSSTEMSKPPVLFDTTPATTSTSQNHNKSKGSTKHNDDQSLIRGKRAVGDGLILHNADGNIILHGNGSKLTFSYDLNTEMLKQQLENSNITELYLWDVGVDPQKAQEIGKILKGSKVKVLSLVHNKIGTTGAIDFGTMLTGTEVTTLNLAHNKIGDERAIDLIKSLKKGNTKVKAVNLASNKISDKGVNDLIPELTDTKIIEVGLMKNIGIKGKTSKKILKVLERNKHINKESHTSTMESSTTEEESSKDISHTGKREKRDIRTTNKPLPKEKSIASTTEKSTVPTTDEFSTTEQDTTTIEEELTAATPEESTTTTESAVTTVKSTVPTTTESTVTTVKSTASTTDESIASSTEDITEQETTTIEEELTTATPEESTTTTESAVTTVKSTVPATKEFSTTKQDTTTIEEELTTAIPEGSTTTTESAVTTVKSTASTTDESIASSTEDITEQETTTPIMEKSSTTTKRVTTSSTEGSTTTEQETTVPTTDGSSTTTTKSTASSAGNPTTDSATVWSNPQKTTTLKEELTTPKKNLTEKSEPIAAGVVADSTTEKHTPKESNPNNPASSTMSIGEILGLISFAVTTIGAVGGTVGWVIKKFFGGVSHLGHEALALAELALVELDINNHKDASLIGVTVNGDVDA
ncbi:hypothetical protein [Candidatus Tisiphia endosymbiont of Psammoecus bipunctatus]|uniref:hypothetical protein n=1 Tax=Candidatus Tisiphia endosymbiont of Psammoecus bipunctatus TaxID=3139333 RepID=UPI0035C9076C